MISAAVLALALAGGMTPGADAAPALAQQPRVAPVAIAAVTAAGLAGAFALDHRAWEAWSDSAATPRHRAGEDISRFGDLRAIGPALIAGYALGRWTKRPALAAASVRIGAGVIGAGVLGLALKYATGRSRPMDAPGDPDEFRPFRGADAFPSGHTTVSFAFAAGLAGEARAAWVPWVAYPAAAVVGWARIAADRHWLSDVVAGAALGTFAGGAVDRRLREYARSHPGVRWNPFFSCAGARPRGGVALSF